MVAVLQRTNGRYFAVHRCIGIFPCKLGGGRILLACLHLLRSEPPTSSARIATSQQLALLACLHLLRSEPPTTSARIATRRRRNY